MPPVAAVAPAIHPSRAAIIGSAPIVPMPMDTASASASLRPPTSGANALPFVASGANAAPAVRPTAAVPVTTGHTPIVVADAGGLTWAHVNQQQQQDRIHSVFIKHPPGYSKDELERVFDVCLTLAVWRSCVVCYRVAHHRFTVYIPITYPSASMMVFLCCVYSASRSLCFAFAHASRSYSLRSMTVCWPEFLPVAPKRRPVHTASQALRIRRLPQGRRREPRDDDPRRPRAQ